jgi:DNA-binding protein YbaB
MTELENERLADFQRTVRDAERYADAPSLRRVEDSVRSMVDAVQEVGAQTHQASDPSGTVTATINGQGELTGVAISAYAIRDLSTEELGTACLAAIAAARQLCSEAVAERLTELFGSAGEADAPGGQGLAGLNQLLRDTAERLR